MKFPTLVLAAAASAAVGSSARAEEITTVTNVELASVSSYIWRGDRLTAGLSPSVQPFADLGFATVESGTFGFGVWTSTSPAEGASMQEVDPYIYYYAPALGPVALKANYSVYLYPTLQPVDNMHELTAQATFDLGIALQPFVGVAVDPIRTLGFYAFAGLQWSDTFGPTTLSASLNFGGSRYHGVEAGFQDATLTTKLTVPIGDDGFYFSANGTLAYSGRADEVYPAAGLGVGYLR